MHALCLLPIIYSYELPISISYFIFVYTYVALMQYVTRHDRKSIRVLASVGEPINPSAWRFTLAISTRYHFLVVLV